jgi:energy-coupling factor transport system ATP-binding protein
MRRHGLHVRDGMGLWIPQACEVGLELARNGVALEDVPLNGDELVRMVRSALPDLDGPAVAPETASAAASGASGSGDVAIEVRDVRFAYEDGPEVLHGVDLEIRRGELLAIVGQNGSGKSTLASLLNGIATPTSGQVLVDGTATVDFDFHDLVRRVAFIFQVPEKQFVGRTVESEMAHGLLSLGLPDEEVARRVDEYLDLVRLSDRRDASPYVLSHGQKRRLSVASMVVGEPEVVILDEPTFGQDYQQAQNLMQLLRRLADDGAAVMFITHDMRLVAEYADRAAVLCRGEKLFDGAPVDLFASVDVLESARLRAPNVFEFSQRLLGRPVLTTQDLVRTITEANHAQR